MGKGANVRDDGVKGGEEEWGGFKGCKGGEGEGEDARRARESVRSSVVGKSSWRWNARELEDTAVGALITEDADDADVETAVAAVADAVSRLVGATRSVDGNTLLVLRSSVEDDIALGALKVGDRVKISTYTAPDDATVDGSVDVERFSREARCVSSASVE